MRMSWSRYREKTKNGYVIHADVESGDGRTLCGYALEGSCVDGETDTGAEITERGKINCPDCLRIIRHCKQIPQTVLDWSYLIP
jgi:hypothetical protein